MCVRGRGVFFGRLCHSINRYVTMCVKRHFCCFRPKPAIITLQFSDATRFKSCFLAVPTEYLKIPRSIVLDSVLRCIILDVRTVEAIRNSWRNPRILRTAVFDA